MTMLDCVLDVYFGINDIAMLKSKRKFQKIIFLLLFFLDKYSDCSKCHCVTDAV